jgi:hypothetical protein
VCGHELDDQMQTAFASVARLQSRIRRSIGVSAAIFAVASGLAFTLILLPTIAMAFAVLAMYAAASALLFARDHRRAGRELRQLRARCELPAARLLE